MKRFLLRFSVFAAIQAVIAAVVLFIGLDDAEKLRRRLDEYLLAMMDKYKLLQDKSRPRIIVVGGSTVAFGIKSPKLVEELDRPAVNLGVHAGLGLRMHLRMMENQLRDGDIVLFLPEYKILSSRSDFEGGKRLTSILLELWPEGAQFFDASFLAREQKPSGDPVLSRLHEATEGAMAKLNSAARRPSKTVYRRSGFNQYGDMIAHYNAPPWDERRKDVLPFRFNRNHAAFVAAELNEFASRAKKCGARVYFGYQPVSILSFQASEKHYAALHEFMQANLQMPILHKPEAVAYPVDRFYDDPNHLNAVGASERTEMLAHTLAPLLKNYVSAPSGSN